MEDLFLQQHAHLTDAAHSCSEVRRVSISVKGEKKAFLNMTRTTKFAEWTKLNGQASRGSPSLRDPFYLELAKHKTHSGKESEGLGRRREHPTTTGLRKI